MSALYTDLDLKYAREASFGMQKPDYGKRFPRVIYLACNTDRSSSFLLHLPCCTYIYSFVIPTLYPFSLFLNRSRTSQSLGTGTAITVFLAAASLSSPQPPYEPLTSLVSGDMLAATLGGILAFNVAAEIAAEREDVKGPNSFRMGVIDELWNLKGGEIKRRAKVVVL